MIEPNHPQLSVIRQCLLLGISRSSFYYEPIGESPINLKLMRMIDEQFLETPFFGSRQMMKWLRRQQLRVCRKRVARLMRKMGLSAIFQKPNTSKPFPGHKIYPYLLKGMAIDAPNKVWCPMSATSRCAGGSCTWWRSWTGTAEKSSPGGCRTPSTPTSV